jgi:hypothetical protein
MMASHRATGGAGVEEFVAWSVGDPDYADHEMSIRKRWASFKPRPGGVTLGTLLKAVSDAGHGAVVQEITRTSPEEDFPDDVEAPFLAGAATVASKPVGAPRPRSLAVWNEWVWVAEPYQFVRRSDTRKYRTDQWKSLFANLKPDGDVLNAIWKNNLPMRKFETLVYLPEAGEFPDGEDAGRYNIWRRSGIEAEPGDVSVFLDHMARLERAVDMSRRHADGRHRITGIHDRCSFCCLARSRAEEAWTPAVLSSI